MDRLYILVGVVLGLVTLYFFASQIQMVFAKIFRAISKKIGTFSATKEYALQRYVYIHQGGLVATCYNWINKQLVASGLKRAGVTPVGYLLFWAMVSVIVTVVLGVLLNLKAGFVIALFFIFYGVFITLARVLISTQLERREADIMDALDLIIPDLGKGVRNAITKYADAFPVSVQGEFKMFLSNMNDRGYTFADAMYILSDNLGLLFNDFAQKAIFYEELGEKDILGIFDDIVEKNRQRRELRYTSGLLFASLRLSFIVSVGVNIAYFFYIIGTDGFSRYFFLRTDAGMILLICMMLIVFAVLAFIETLRSRDL